MKKILAAILAGTFGLTAVAQTVVYDYKASFKRVNPVHKVRTVDAKKVATESYGVSSDQLVGYIVIDECIDCGKATAQPFPGTGVAYITRKGDKYTTVGGDKAVKILKANTVIDAAIFGDNAFIINAATKVGNANPHQLKDVKKAWMMLKFNVPAKPVPAVVGIDELAPEVLMKGTKGLPINYGFLGIDHVGDGTITKSGTIMNYGFGTISQTKETTKDGDVDVCADGSTVVYPGCRQIQSISGSMLGEFGYMGPCNAVPMWDLCIPNETNPAISAPIAGTWTLKFNKSLSGKEGKDLTDAIAAKLAGKKEVVIVQ